jgi:hypothetical protein
MVPLSIRPYLRKTSWPGADIVAGKQQCAAAVGDPGRDRRRIAVGEAGDRKQDGETRDHHDARRAQPPG